MSRLEYVLHIFILISIYAILAVSLDLVMGEAGLLSIAHAAFYGLGAYASAILTTKFGTSFVFGLVAGMAIAALLSLAVSLPSIRVNEDYFVITTFGLQIVFFPNA